MMTSHLNTIHYVRYYESELQAQLIPTNHPKPKELLINRLLCLCIYLNMAILIHKCVNIIQS